MVRALRGGARGAAARAGRGRRRRRAAASRCRASWWRTSSAFRARTATAFRPLDRRHRGRERERRRARRRPTPWREMFGYFGALIEKRRQRARGRHDLGAGARPPRHRRGGLARQDAGHRLHDGDRRQRHHHGSARRRARAADPSPRPARAAPRGARAHRTRPSRSSCASPRPCRAWRARPRATSSSRAGRSPPAARCCCSTRPRTATSASSAPDAEACDVTRRIRRQLTFSYGPHHCIGAAAARLQATHRPRGAARALPRLRGRRRRRPLRPGSLRTPLRVAALPGERLRLSDVWPGPPGRPRRPPERACSVPADVPAQRVPSLLWAANAGPGERR